MRKTLLAAAAMVTAVPAYAAPVITFNQNFFGITPASGSIFQTFSGSTANAAYATGPNETTTGNVQVYNGSITGVTADPDGTAGNNYLAVTGTYSIAFNTAVQTFSFVLGSLDSYNAITFNLTNGSSLTLAGGDLVGVPGLGNFYNSNWAGRVTYQFSGNERVSSVMFASSNASFEIDDLASAVPEPMTWAMLVGGFGLIGGTLRTGRRYGLANA